MRSVALIALDLLLEARSRRWVLALLGAITLIALSLAAGLQMEVVDGVLAMTRLFGDDLGHDITSADVALRPVFVGAGTVTFTFGLLFAVVAFADFAPELLAPGRIEHLVSLPIRRWELIVGTYVGVNLLALVCASYGGVLFTALLGVKSGVWSPALIWSSLSGCVAFMALYGPMLAAVVWVRSPALSAALGILVFVLGTTITLPETAALLNPGYQRWVFGLAVSWIPRFWELSMVSAFVVGVRPTPPGLVGSLAASAVFGLAWLCVAVGLFERKDC